MTESNVRHIFVYGSLRPDDDSCQPWTKDAVSGMTAQKAVLWGAKLFLDQYACAVLDDSQQPITPQSLSNNEEFNKDKKTCIHGYVLSIDDDNVDLFQEKLTLFDSIEGYRCPNSPSNLYERSIEEVELIEEKQSIPKFVKSFVYHRTHQCDKSNPIPSGDWLQRRK